MAAIYEFDPIIYPTRLWVSKLPDPADVERLFYPIDNEGKVVEDWGNTFLERGVYAITVRAGSRSNLMRGCLIALRQPRLCSAGICAHEALHWVVSLAEELSIPCDDFDSSEAWAYLEQWATNCIWSVLTNRPEQEKGIKLE